MARRAANGVVYTGPFFEHDPGKRVGENIADLVREITRETVPMVRSQMTSGRASDLAATIAERSLTVTNRTYRSSVYSTMSGPLGSTNPHSWVTFAETGRRRIGGVTVPAKKFKGFRQWSKVNSAIRRHIKDERVRLAVMKGVV
jgi:hypothetical protein